MKVLLRPWKNSDVDNLVEQANNIHVAYYLTDIFPHPYTYTDGINFIALTLADEQLRHFAIVVNDKAVGSIGIYPQNDIRRKNAEIGYWLGEAYWNKGIMTNTVQAMVYYAFDNFDFTRLFARVMSMNHSSCRVLEKAGFTLEATIPKSLYKNNAFYDELLFGIRNTKSVLQKTKKSSSNMLTL